MQFAFLLFLLGCVVLVQLANPSCASKLARVAIPKWKWESRKAGRDVPHEDANIRNEKGEVDLMIFIINRLQWGITYMRISQIKTWTIGAT